MCRGTGQRDAGFKVALSYAPAAARLANSPARALPGTGQNCCAASESVSCSSRRRRKQRGSMLSPAGSRKMRLINATGAAGDARPSHAPAARGQRDARSPSGRDATR
eukprot:1549346-Pyramimonas_sp.AAC.1